LTVKHSLTPSSTKKYLYSLLLQMPLATILLLTPAQAARLESWKLNPTQTQLDFTTDEGVRPRAQLIQNPTRLVIDLPGIRLGRSQVTQSFSGNIRSLRVGQPEPNTARIVIELAPGYTIDPGKVRFQGTTDQRWSVQLPTPERITAQIPGRPVLFPNAPVPIPVPPAPKQPDVATPIPPRGKTVVVIDPGHGGPDPGAVGIGGIKEKEIVLDISKRVEALLEQQGVQTVMARSQDVNVELEPRVALANRLNSTVFVSIHANAINLSRQDINGLETYYYSTGYNLARTIHQSVLQATGIPDRGVRSARFYVIRNTRMPSVLVEVGFVTGRDDAKRLRDLEYRQKMASAIARGILRYLGRSA
jgi:N-acetylmuramoyl-L-alanine amidase